MKVETTGAGSTTNDGGIIIETTGVGTGGGGGGSGAANTNNDDSELEQEIMILIVMGSIFCVCCLVFICVFGMSMCYCVKSQEKNAAQTKQLDIVRQLELQQQRLPLTLNAINGGSSGGRNVGHMHGGTNVHAMHGGTSVPMATNFNRLVSTSYIDSNGAVVQSNDGIVGIGEKKAVSGAHKNEINLVSASGSGSGGDFDDVDAVDELYMDGSGNIPADGKMFSINIDGNDVNISQQDLVAALKKEGNTKQRENVQDGTARVAGEDVDAASEL